jgi:hypothetical protein
MINFNLLPIFQLTSIKNKVQFLLLVQHSTMESLPATVRLCLIFLLADIDHWFAQAYSIPNYSNPMSETNITYEKEFFYE